MTRLSNPTRRLRTPFANNTIPGNRIDIAATRNPEAAAAAKPARHSPTTSRQPAWASSTAPTSTSRSTTLRQQAHAVWPLQPFAYAHHRPPIFGEVSGPALNGGQLGTAPGLINVIGIGGTYTFSPTRRSGRKRWLHAPAAGRARLRYRFELRVGRPAKSQAQTAPIIFRAAFPRSKSTAGGPISATTTPGTHSCSAITSTSVRRTFPG